MTEARSADRPPLASRTDIAALVAKMGEAVATLAHADHTDKQALYEQVGLRLTYYPEDRTVVVEAGPGRHVRNGVSEGGFEPP
jgi:site-specific DNA recombinase